MKIMNKYQTVCDCTGMQKYPNERESLIEWATSLIHWANRNDCAVHDIISGLKTTQSGIQIVVDVLMKQRQEEVEKMKKLREQTP